MVRMQQFALGGSRKRAQFAEYLREGVLHIWTGYDHILFLLSLLLPAVLVRGDRRESEPGRSAGLQSGVLGVF